MHQARKPCAATIRGGPRSAAELGIAAVANSLNLNVARLAAVWRRDAAERLHTSQFRQWEENDIDESGLPSC